MNEHERGAYMYSAVDLNAERINVLLDRLCIYEKDRETWWRGRQFDLESERPIDLLMKGRGEEIESALWRRIESAGRAPRFWFLA